MSHLNKQGFTLVELMLAMTLFSAVMIVATVGFIGMNRTFARGVIRKELSEATQNLTEDATRAIRAQGINTTVQMCNEQNVAADCFAAWSSVCLAQVRYVWQSSDSKMYKDAGPCTANPESSAKLQMVNDRYKVQKFEIIKDSTKQGLFRIKGVLTTKESDALTMTTDGDPYTYTCKGSGQSASVSTCAVEKFSFIVNARGRQ